MIAAFADGDYDLGPLRPSHCQSAVQRTFSHPPTPASALRLCNLQFIHSKLSLYSPAADLISLTVDY
eukprot:290353-Pleurochrysis_carterae.AAC.1